MTGGGARVVFAGPGPPVQVDVVVPAALDAVRALLPVASEEEPVGPADLVLRGETGDYEIQIPGGVWSAPGLADILTRLELCIAEELVRRSGLVALHAGGVTVPRGALLIAGESGSGKSTLTAGLAHRGYPVLGDDAVLLAPDGFVQPLKRRLKVEEPARTLLGLPEAEGPLASIWPEASFYDPEALGSRWADPSPVHAVVLPERGGHRTPVLTELGAVEALGEVLGQVLLEEQVSRDAFEAAAAAVGETRCYRLSYGDGPAAVATLAAALG